MSEIPEASYRAPGLAVDSKGLYKLADDIRRIGDMIARAEGLSQPVTNSGGLLIAESINTETKVKTMRITSDLGVHFGPEPAFNWNEASHLNPAHLRITEYDIKGSGGWSSTKYGIRVTHIPTMLEGMSHDGRTQHSNRAQATQNLIKALNDKFGVTTEQPQ